MLAEVRAVLEPDGRQIVEIDVRADHAAGGEGKPVGKLMRAVGKITDRTGNVGPKQRSSQARKPWKGRGLQRNSVDCTISQIQRRSTSAFG